VCWPDLASAQHAKDTLARLEDLKILCDTKEENPLNIPSHKKVPADGPLSQIG
jgi:hypothetical protein